MRPSAQRGTARSLRLKLTLWFLTFFSILHVLLLVAVISFRSDLVHRSNQSRVESWARAMVDNILVEEPEWKQWTRDQITPLFPFDARFELLVIRAADGRELVSWPAEVGARVPFSSNERVPAGPLGAVFSTVVGERASALVQGEARVEILTLPFRAGGEFYLQVGVREGEIEGVLRPFLDLFLLGIPLASLAALAAAWMISGRAVQPLLRLSRAARDVSPSRLGERILLESTDQEVSALQRELNLALERLEGGYRSQEEFISNVSHELRTPIAVLRSQSQLLLEGEQELASHQAFAASVEEETQRLGRLVESFLALARQGWTRRLETAEEVAAVDVVLDTVRHAAPLAEKHGVRLTPQINVDEPEADAPVVSGDTALLETMLENLVRNAIRFAPRGSAVLIQALTTDEHVVFRVRDHGPGIPDELLEHVFERFVTWADAGGGGSGIGLSIAREVAELHGGRVTAANAPGGGAVFSVVLPRVRGR